MTIELIDVLAPDLTPTGTRKSKRQIHRDGDWHRAVHVWIAASDGRVLLQRRSPRKENHPGLWDVSAAGHVSAGETAAQAAVRETFEELGLAIGPAELEPLGSMTESCVLNGGTYIDNEIHEILLVRRDVAIGTLRLDPEEVAEVKWVSDLCPDASFVPHAREYALLSRSLRSAVRPRG